MALFAPIEMTFEFATFRLPELLIVAVASKLSPTPVRTKMALLVLPLVFASEISPELLMTASTVSAVWVSTEMPRPFPERVISPVFSISELTSDSERFP